MKQLDSLQTSEFLEPSKVRDPQLDPPLVTIQIRETRVGRTAATSATDALVLDLHIGRWDAARKVFFAQLANDEVVLTLPDTLLDVLPKNAMAFRDRSIVSISPADVRKLIITRAGRIDELVPEQSGEPNRWRMRRPIDAAGRYPLDHADPGDPRESASRGISSPTHKKTRPSSAWTSRCSRSSGRRDGTHRLKVGAQVPREPAYYAATRSAVRLHLEGRDPEAIRSRVS